MTDVKQNELNNMSLGVKLCTKCEKVKPLLTGYYKAGTSYQKYCKPCHNARRSEYPNPSNYKPKTTGFMKLPEEIRNKVIYDIYVRVNFKDIYKKYTIEYPKEFVNYSTLVKWNREGQIPKYNPATGKPNYIEEL